ncbi:hypothetical protein [Corticimicrobacter populi]|uniref:Uncharacterized protein n=1 Tax=Corticimicrobacter populi TaxID=2175229 RepID=A0A2V1K0F5_9BURK|nr:hypothetical protein [Corticimicrobacter populi]PWF23219.1 hypothetical protein DD235_09530 [Corticimicrobacter populi]
MIEVAWKYCRAGLADAERNGLDMATQALGTLAIEIVLKSYNAVVTANHGTLDERYAFDRNALLQTVSADGTAKSSKASRKSRSIDQHNLRHLVDALPAAIKAYLLNEVDDDNISKHQDAFKQCRYYYEQTVPANYDDTMIRLAVALICKTVYLYQQQGCTDPFILTFDVNGLYRRHVQPVLGVWLSAAGKFA